MRVQPVHEDRGSSILVSTAVFPIKESNAFKSEEKELLNGKDIVEKKNKKMN